MRVNFKVIICFILSDFVSKKVLSAKKIEPAFIYAMYSPSSSEWFFYWLCYIS